MTINKILHIMVIDKFIPPFIKFIEENFKDTVQNHIFFIFGKSDLFPVENKNNIIVINKGKDISKYILLINLMNKSDRIILHGLFNKKITQALALQPWLLKKSYWVIWGGDLYKYQNHKKNISDKIEEIFRRFTIKRLGNLVTYVDGDIDLARKWYDAKGKYHECIMYTSNIYENKNFEQINNNKINIQIGNSADPSNNHLEILETLLPYKDKDIAIHAPLSYGNQEHAKNIISIGNKYFGDKFHPITKIIAAEDYVKFLEKIDIAIFNHKRQQAMGNTITLLGLGKKVYLRTDVSSWNTLLKIGATIFDIEKFSLEPIDEITKTKNQAIIKLNFSKEKLINQLTNLFN